MSPSFRKKSDFTEVSCPDGPRFLLKEPSKAFSIFFPQYKTLLKTIIKDLTNIDIGISKKTISMVKDLDEDYALLQAHYKVAYVTYCANPCNKEAFDCLQETNKDIRDQIFVLRKIRMSVQKQRDR